MKTRIHSTLAAVGLAAVLSGCGSAYSGLTASSGLGSDQYRPAVVVEPGNEARYEQVLAVCRQVAANRQATAAQKAQLETLTGVVESAGVGAAAGAAYGGLLDSGGFDTSVDDRRYGGCRRRAGERVCQRRQYNRGRDQAHFAELPERDVQGRYALAGGGVIRVPEIRLAIV